MSLTKVSYAMINGDPVNVLDYGAVGDGIANDTAALQAAAAIGKPIYLPEGNYLITASITLTNDLYGPGTITFANLVAVVINADYITIDGVNFAGTSNTGTAAAIAIFSTQNSYLTVKNCVITNSRVTVRNQQLAFVYGFRFQNNTVNADFTNVEHIINQNDVLTVRGVNGVWITDNNFTILNVHRVFKIADTEAATTAGTPYRDRNIYITNNRVVGSTDSGKQVMDLYFFTSDIIISNNTFEVTGFGTVIENKTGETQNYNQNTIITNNILSNDDTCVLLQGSYGSTNPAYNVGYQNAIIEGNVLISTTDTLVGTPHPLNLRFYNSMQVINNNIITPIIFSQTTGLPAIEIGSCGYTIINNNSISNGLINNVVFTTNSQAETFDAEMYSIEIQGNTIANFGGSGVLGGIVVSNVNKPNLSVNINGNYVKQNVDAVVSAGCVGITNSTINNFVVSNNIGVMANAAEQRLRILTSTITEVVEANNSWNQIGRASITYDPGAIGAGGIETTTLTVTGATANTDVVTRVQFGRALQGLVLTAWVSATDTVTVQFYNPTGGSIDLLSGTLSVVVQRFTAV